MPISDDSDANAIRKRCRSRNGPLESTLEAGSARRPGSVASGMRRSCRDVAARTLARGGLFALRGVAVLRERKTEMAAQGVVLVFRADQAPLSQERHHLLH